MKQKLKIKFGFNSALMLILVAAFIIIANLNSAFMSPEYILQVVLKNAVEIGILALPMTLIITTGGIDLSCGSNMVLSAIVGGIVGGQYGSAAGVAATLILGTLCGLINGIIIAKVRVPAMITTLATMYLYLGIAKGISKGDSIYSYPAATFLGNYELFGIPIQLFIYVVLALVFVVLLHKAQFGRGLTGIGLNEKALRYCGIDTDKYLIAAYTLEGVMAAVAALIWIGRFTSLKYDAGTNMHMKAITIVVLGGTSIAGGVGDMRGTIIGTLILAVLNSGLTVLNIPIDAQAIIQGAVLLTSLIVYAFIHKRQKMRKLIKG